MVEPRHNIWAAATQIMSSSPALNRTTKQLRFRDKRNSGNRPIAGEKPTPITNLCGALSLAWARQPGRDCLISPRILGDNSGSVQ
jgi:hypothetical protein